MPEIGLSEVVRALRAELETAMTEADDQRVLFQARNVELEFQVGVTREATASGGLKFWVLELGAGGTHAKESIQRVSLCLEPMLAGGGGVKIAKGSDESPLG